MYIGVGVLGITGNAIDTYADIYDTLIVSVVRH